MKNDIRKVLIASTLLLSMSLNLPHLAVAKEETLDIPKAPQAALKQNPGNPTPDSKPLTTPSAPNVNAKSFILIDVNSGKILAEKNSTQRLQPASLTKIMTMYIISDALKRGQIKLTDKVSISKKAWQTGGSRMFVQVGDEVPAEALIRGIIVQSGNDACVAMAEHIAGSEESFADLMNQQAKNLGMANTHFMDSTGMPDPNHYTTSKDMAILGRAIIQHFPEFYPWYKQQWFVYNGIKQPNRNRLLWRNSLVDGIKTGHTAEAGFCLVASAVKDNMRLLSVILGAPSEEKRTADTQSLLTYGYRFFETHKLYRAGQALQNPRVWQGSNKTIPVGLDEDLNVTIPTGQYKNLSAVLELQKGLKAPIKKGQVLGDIQVTLDKEIVTKRPLIALSEDPRGGLWVRMRDKVKSSLYKWFGVDSES
jgi:serine-type D-Ala-D-Ala carboxypeptidase (penicillin-binding protein 5/6)